MFMEMHTNSLIVSFSSFKKNAFVAGEESFSEVA